MSSLLVVTLLTVQGQDLVATESQSNPVVVEKLLVEQKEATVPEKLEAVPQEKEELPDVQSTTTDAPDDVTTTTSSKFYFTYLRNLIQKCNQIHSLYIVNSIFEYDQSELMSSIRNRFTIFINFI